jgi:S-adenosylmethionine hydrolase
VSIITLLTDFGTADYYIAAMKGVILSRNPAVCIVDISHEIAPQSTLSAAYVLFGAYANFPANTVHLVVVDPGVGSSREPIVARASNHIFVGPDNGVFSLVLRDAPNYEAYRITNRSLLAPNISNTFQGRDVFAPVAAALSLGTPLHEIGERFLRIQLLPEPTRLSLSFVESKIIHIDHFGNCVTGIKRTVLPSGELPPTFKLEANKNQIQQLKRFYLEETVPPDKPFVIWGSLGFLEISLVSSSAAEHLGLKTGDPVRLHYSVSAE